MADVARGTVLLTPKFDNLTSSISQQLGAPFSKSGADSGAKWTAGFSGKMGAIIGVASNLASRGFDAIAASMGNAVARADTMRNFPKVMKNLGYSAGDANESIKRMSNAIDGMPTSLPALTSMVQQLAPLAGGLDKATSLGIAFNDMCLASGASTADVSRAMQQYSQILAKGKPELQDWRTLQEVMPGQLNQVAKALLGPTKNSNDLYKALKKGSVSMGDFNKAVMDLDQKGTGAFASFRDQAKDATQGIGTAIENVRNRIAKAIQVIIESIGVENIAGAINGITSTFVPAAEGIAGGITRVKDAISGMDPGQLKAITSTFVPAAEGIAGGITRVKDAISGMDPGQLKAIAGGIAALGTALSVTNAAGGISSALPAIAGAAKAAAKPIGDVVAAIQLMFGGGGIGGALSALIGPATAVVAVIAAVAAGFAYMMTTSEGFRDAVGQAVGAISEGMAPAAQALSDAFKSAQPVISAFCGFITGTLLPALGNIGLAFLQVVATVAPFVGQLLATVIPVLAQIAGFVAQVAGVIGGVLGAAFQIVGAIVQTVWPAIQMIIQGVCYSVVAIIQTFAPVITGIISTAMAIIQGIIDVVLGIINMDWSTIWQTISTTVSGILGGIQAFIVSTLNGLASSVGSVLNSIKTFFSNAWDSVKSGVTSAFEGIVGAVKKGVDDAVNKVKGIKDKIVGFFKGAGEWLSDAGKSIMDGLIGGITDGIDDLGKKLGGIGDFIAKHKGPPSYDRVMLVPAGRLIMDGLVKGIGDGIPQLASMLSDVTDAIAIDGSVSVGASASSRLSAIRGVRGYTSEATAQAGGTTYNLIIDGAKVNDHGAIREDFVSLMYDLHRLGAMTSA
ncbi:MAG: tape measure protein [Collinsella sp.]|nr:tape measure protein [Collinsella sp.]